MLGRIGALAALGLLAACAGVQSAGRNTVRDAAPAPPPPAMEAPAPEPQRPEPSVAAPNVSVATPAPTQSQPPPSGGRDIVVPGQVERQVPVPNGDPRSTAERMADIRAWDRCVMAVQGEVGGDPMRPQLDAPEEVCRNQLGMADRTAVPNSRR